MTISTSRKRDPAENAHNWLFIVAIVAGVAWFAFTKFGDGAQDLDANESVFSFYHKPTELPELKFLNRKNREITLDVFKGSVVLLNIWATWCVPCRDEMPALDDLQAQLGGPDFEVIALSIDRNPRSVIENFYEDLELKQLKIYHDPTGEASFTLRVPGIPATYLIDREGRAIGYRIGPAEWDNAEIVDEIRGYIIPQYEETK